MKTDFKFMAALIWLTQLGMSIAVPAGLCIVIAVWLQNRFELGSWIMIVGCLLGIAASADSMYHTMKAMGLLGKTEKESKTQPVAFNDHK